MSLATQLTSVQAAITSIEGGAQEVVFEGRRVRYADISVLYARERELTALIAADARGASGITISRGATL